MSDVPSNGDPTFTRITNREVWVELQALRKAVTSLERTVTDEMPDLRKRVRSLELRFYGILAGLIAALGTIVYVKGGV